MYKRNPMKTRVLWIGSSVLIVSLISATAHAGGCMSLPCKGSKKKQVSQGSPSLVEVISSPIQPVQSLPRALTLYRSNSAPSLISNAALQPAPLSQISIPGQIEEPRFDFKISSPSEATGQELLIVTSKPPVTDPRNAPRSAYLAPAAFNRSGEQFPSMNLSEQNSLNLFGQSGSVNAHYSPSPSRNLHIRRNQPEMTFRFQNSSPHTCHKPNLTYSENIRFLVLLAQAAKTRKF